MLGGLLFLLEPLGVLTKRNSQGQDDTSLLGEQESILAGT